MVVIYGINTSKPYTAKDVRDAVVECFYLAHQEVLKKQYSFVDQEPKDKLEEMKKHEVRQLVREFFDKTDGDYDKPTKKSIMKTCDISIFKIHFIFYFW